MHTPALQTSPLAQVTPMQLLPQVPFWHFLPTPQSTPKQASTHSPALLAPGTHLKPGPH